MTCSSTLDDLQQQPFQQQPAGPTAAGIHCKVVMLAVEIVCWDEVVIAVVVPVCSTADPPQLCRASPGLSLELLELLGHSAGCSGLILAR
jgi:hypothetical protein